MKKIKIFPDYSSSGMWVDDDGDECGYMVDTEDISHAVPAVMILALQYWHDMWDYKMSNPCDDPDHKGMSASYHAEWLNDGQTIVDAMNAAQQEFEFIYDRDLSKLM